MAFLSASRPNLELMAIKRQLEEGLISGTDASAQIGDIVFDGTEAHAAAREIWRKYDEAFIKQLLVMLDEML